MSNCDCIKRAKEVFDNEIAGVKAVRDNLGESFTKLVNMASDVIDQGGKLIRSGVGKSGYIGKKIAATLASVGSPAIFMHPVEARHGDLGVIQQNDILIAISYSGETEELLSVLNPAKRLGVSLVSITASKESTLGKVSDLVIEMPVPGEACPFNLAPTTSTTALLVLGDALAMVLLDQRGFTKSDYGRRHPGGAIGRMVTMCAGDLMRKAEKSAVVTISSTVRETIYAMTHARCGSAIVSDESGKLLGIFTDGDFRRRAAQNENILDLPMKDVMTANPVTVSPDTLAVEVVKTIEKRKIDDIVVVDAENHVLGLIDVQDLPGLKIM
jgi:arabinose-5-phosphate isomerase